MKHVTVLETEAVDGLNINKHSVVVDATFGSGGHARKIISILGSNGTYIGIDADRSTFADIDDVFVGFTGNKHLVTDNFRNLSSILESLKLASVDAILADLGWRTEQFLEGEKGFSFDSDSPLYMTFGDPKDYSFTAHDIVNDWEEKQIADVIYGYGDERQSRRIAKAIVAARSEKTIETARELAEIVESAIPPRFRPKRIHTATKTFQALRIAVNDEFEAIEDLIKASVAHLTPQGRLGIISFHSGEDRLVKTAFAELVRTGTVHAVTKKPIVPTDTEQTENPRSRSAKLRIIEKV